MISKRTRQFNKLFAKLHPQVQEQATKAYQLFKQNPYHPSLHFEPISQQEPIYSVRVGRSYRAVGRLEGDTIYWEWIGSHEAYNNIWL